MTSFASRTTVRMIAALGLLPLAGCGAVVIETATVALDQATLWREIDDARAGDAEAQYAVGNALCCSGDVADGALYSTTEAMDWLCAAARQGNDEAMIKLAKIFEGDQIDGLRILRRAIDAPFSTPENLAAAHYWYARAAERGAAGAADDAAELNASMTAAEQAAATRYAAASTPPCTWADLTLPVPAAALEPVAQVVR